MFMRIEFALVVTALLVPMSLPAQTTTGPSTNSDLEQDVERIRDATRAFRDVEAARAAGYPNAVPDRCLDSTAGTMGYHFLNPDLSDATLEVERPEILVYAPTRDGGLKLAGVEYIVPYTAWASDSVKAPRILGQDLKRADSLHIWYLHVWVWEENPRGLFADWNPALSCSPYQGDPL